MPNRYISLIIFLILISLNCYSASSYAENPGLVLSIQDLTWLSCEPNEKIEKVIEKLQNEYKISMSSMEYAGHNSYVGGDPTPAMSWLLTIEKNWKGKLVRMEYGRFKESDRGVNVATNRGIKYSSSIASVYDSYGTNPSVIRRQHPMMNYIDLQYPFVIKGTRQKGKLIFTLHYNLGDSEQNATVIWLKWILFCS